MLKISVDHYSYIFNIKFINSKESESTNSCLIKFITFMYLIRFCNFFVFQFFLCIT